jgi:hypothetical protein
MLTRKSILTMTTAAALCAAPLLAFGQQNTGGSSAQPQATQTSPQTGVMSGTAGAQSERNAGGGLQAQGTSPSGQGGSAPGGGAAGRGTTANTTPAPAANAPDGTPGNPPSTATQRAADSATGTTTPPDGTPGNPPGTAAGRAADRALGTNMSGSNPQGANAATGATTPPMAVDSMRLREGRRASRIIGSTVYNENNESIGEVDDLIIAREGGAPTAIISVGGFLGIGARLVAVPLERLSWNGERERWAMPGATKDSLGSLPAFNYDADRGNRRG